MTVSTLYTPLTYNGAGGAGPFSVTWPFLSPSDLRVTHIVSGVETLKTYPTHYTVSGGVDAGGIPQVGSVTMQAGHEPATGTQLKIERSTPRTQSTSLPENGTFSAKAIEAAFDRGVLMIQEAGSSGGAGATGDVLRLNTAGATDFYDAGAFVVRTSATPTVGTDLVTKAFADANYGPASTEVAAHLLRTDNPHDVTAQQLGLMPSLFDYIPSNLHAVIRAGTSTTDVSSYIQTALTAVGSGTVFAPRGTYVCDSAITIGSAGLIGEGRGDWLDALGTVFLFRGTGARARSFANCGSTTIANPSAGEAYLADSGTRGDAYVTTDYTAPFSAAMTIGEAGRAKEFAVVLNHNGTAGYALEDGALGDDWDVGLLVLDSNMARIERVQSYGYWRKAGCLFAAVAAGTGCDGTLFDNCQFKGFRGLALRSPDPESGTWGFGGSVFLGCKFNDLVHTNGHFATSSALTAPFASPSSAIEFDGGSLRGVHFVGCTTHAREVLAIFADADEMLFTSCYWEAKAGKVSGEWLTTVGCPVVATSSASLVMHTNTKTGADFAPFFTRESGVTRFTAGGAFSPATAADDDYDYPRGTSNGLRMRPNTPVRMYDASGVTQHSYWGSGDAVHTGRVVAASFEGEHHITVADDAVGQIAIGTVATMAFVQQTHPSVPTSTRVALLSVDSGTTPAMTTVHAGTGMANGGAAVPTGTTGTDGVATVYVQQGTLYINNRLGASNTFNITLIGGYSS